MNNSHQGFNLSPLDDRYRSIIQPLTHYFSAHSFAKYRLQIETNYLIYFFSHVLSKPLIPTHIKYLTNLIQHFDQTEYQYYLEFENIIHHDVKAIEYYLRQKLIGEKSYLMPYIHIGLTSEDINNIAYSLMLKDGLQQVIIPKLKELISVISTLSGQYKSAFMLARTHGQPAVPTTMGKELFVFVWRLNQELINLNTLPCEAKLNGAVGNHNALVIAFPDTDWVRVTNNFIKSLKLVPHQYTTQILPGDSMVRIFQNIHLINSILLGFTQDMWRYISDGYFVQDVKLAEVGSSTMPHKVNPINFENCEGNLGLANALFEYFIRKLPISRLQRDLSDSTVKRNIGVGLGYSLTAYSSLIAGLKKINFNQTLANQQLKDHWEVVTEGIQTILRTSGDEKAYEKLKKLSRGKQLTKASLHKYINSLDVSEKIKKQLTMLTPHSYVGLASELVTHGLKKLNQKRKK